MVTSNSPGSAPTYVFDPRDKPSLPQVNVPLIVANDETVAEYGYLVDDFDACNIEIVRWPAQGWRPVDSDSGNEGGTTEGVFQSFWRGDVLMGRNDAVSGEYVLGFGCDPSSASVDAQASSHPYVLLWHMNYHPDGGQVFFPTERAPFVVPVALPGDDLKPEHVVAFWCDGTRGLYIHPNIWHEGVFPTTDEQRFLDRQGAVHARVSCDFGDEFGVYLKVPLTLSE